MSILVDNNIHMTSLASSHQDNLTFVKNSKAPGTLPGLCIYSHMNSMLCLCKYKFQCPSLKLRLELVTSESLGSQWGSEVCLSGLACRGLMQIRGEQAHLQVNL